MTARAGPTDTRRGTPQRGRPAGGQLLDRLDYDRTNPIPVRLEEVLPVFTRIGVMRYRMSHLIARIASTSPPTFHVSGTLVSTGRPTHPPHSCRGTGSLQRWWSCGEQQRRVSARVRTRLPPCSSPPHPSASLNPSAPGSRPAWRKSRPAEFRLSDGMLGFDNDLPHLIEGLRSERLEGKMFRSWAIPGLMIVLVSMACAEDSSAPTELAPNDLRASLNASTTPSKRPSWNERSTEAIWDYIVQSDTTVIVGLATPGKRHGVIQGELALSRAEWNTARDFVRRLPVLVPLKEDTFLPAMLLKLKTRQALDLLRGNKFIDYVEPAIYRPPEGYSFWADESSGCGDHSTWTGARERLPSGDLLPWNYKYGQMQVVDAWRRSKGYGVTIGLIDTGIDPTQKQLNGSWASGSSTGRWHRKSYTQAGDEPYLPKWTDRCGHGTHEAGVIGAPLNGNGTVGIALERI